ncbi:hypothetical protein D3C80_1557940 [compost metagenome]
MPSTTAQLRERYNEQLNALLKGPRTACDRFSDGASSQTGRKARAAFFRAYRKARRVTFPRGTNFVLRFEGSI